MIRRLPLAMPLLAVMASLLLANPAAAHKLSVFAAAAGAEITGKVYFAGGQPARGITVSVVDKAGKTLGLLTTDDHGAFRYRAEERLDHQFIADTGDGHAATFTVKAYELPETLPSVSGRDEEKTGGGTTASVSAPPLSPPDHMKEWIEQAVARQVRPLREETAALRDQIRLRDILGGIGYIVGLAGILAWIDARRRKKHP